MRSLMALRRPRLDPAPSRLTYRLQRLMLTPMFRRFLRVGLPFAFAFGLGLGYLSQPARQEAILQTISDLRTGFENRPEFMVGMMRIDGASAGVEEDIREIFPYDLPISSFDLPLDNIRKLVEGLPAVADASVRIRSGGVLAISLHERAPAALWKTRDGMVVLDREGVVIRDLAGAPAPGGLPLLAGTGADTSVAEALRLVHAAAPLGARLLGLVRVGERRWNVMLRGGARIMLPTRNPVPALERVLVLDETQDLLARDLVAVDMRLPDRPTLRLKRRAVAEWRRVQALSEGAVQE